MHNLSYSVLLVPMAHSNSFSQPQGAPRGLLVHYILHRISVKPSHGYELLQDIETKTAGAWRPGPGSIYPILKKLLADGLLETERTGRVSTAQHVYHITTKGKQRLDEAKKMFANASQRWSSLRRIFVEMLDPEDIGNFVINGSKMQFETGRELLESKLVALPPSEAEFILKEYALNLERQLEWTRSALSRIKRRKAVPLIKS